MSEIKVGIDPGLTGAVALVCDDWIKLYDMPVCEKPWPGSTGRKIVDVKGLATILREHKPDIVQVQIEVVQAMQRDGAVGAFAFGGTFYSAITTSILMGF